MKKTKQKKISYNTFVDAQGMTYEAIAKETGYQNASSVRYVFYTALEKILKEICPQLDLDYNKLDKKTKEIILRSNEFQDLVKDAYVRMDTDYDT